MKEREQSPMGKSKSVEKDDELKRSPSIKEAREPNDNEDLHSDEGLLDGDEGKENVNSKYEKGAKQKKHMQRLDRSKLSNKPEDFQVRVKILSGRRLAGRNIKPVVNVKAGPTQAKNTQICKGSDPVWNELMVFNFHESLKELCDFIFEFAVNCSRKLRADALIGLFKLDLGNVYEQPGQAYVRKWLLLTDPDDGSNAPKGYLKVTICMLKAGDHPPEDKPEEEEDDVEGNLLTPAGASMSSALLTLRIYNAEDLPQMDSSAFNTMKKLIGIDAKVTNKTLIDPYLNVLFAGKKRKTQVIEGNNYPRWNEELKIPILFPSMSDTIKLTVKDWDRIGTNESVGTVAISMSKISSTGEASGGAGFLPTFGPTFVNFYGSPREYAGMGGRLDQLNKGKGEGCAYRGRAMIEITTLLDEEINKVPAGGKPIAEEHIDMMQKHLYRRRYHLVVGFIRAGLIDKRYERLQFEVSMGNYGNRSDDDIGASCSVTDSISPVYDGCKYYYLPWTDKKPITVVSSQWENINFRLQALNFILRLCDKMDYRMKRLKQTIDKKASGSEVASEIIDFLDAIIVETAKHLPDPSYMQTANQLDTRIHQQRLKTFKSVSEDAKDLRMNCSDASVAIEAISDIIDRLKSTAHEPQNSLPDVVVWMIAGDKRVAFTRIPAYEILYCQSNREFCGRWCSKPTTMQLKEPTAKATSKKHFKIPCQIEIIAWLGLSKEQESFYLPDRGQIAVYADTYEMEAKVPIRGWVSDGYKDMTGEILLPKDGFICPHGWEWDEAWEVSTDSSHRNDAGQIHYQEEYFEYEERFRGTGWTADKIVNGFGDVISDPESVQCPKGWEWRGEWALDTARACDEDGWDYSTHADSFGELCWSTIEKPFHAIRRRRMVRTRKNVDPKRMKKYEREERVLSKGWEYAATSKSQYHPHEKIIDLVRRRKWIRKMVTSKKDGASAIFNLQHALMQGDSKYFPLPLTPMSGVPSKAQALLGAKGSGDGGFFQEDKIGRKLLRKMTTISDPHGESATEERKRRRNMPSLKIFLLHSFSSQLQLRIYIYQGRDFLAMDKDSLSDPAVYVSFLNCCRRTSVVHRTVNPVWDETLLADITFFGDLNMLMKHSNKVALEVVHEDPLNKMMLIGRTVGEITFKFDPSRKEPTRLTWLEVSKNRRYGGSILCAFELFLKQENFPFPPVPPRRGKDQIIVPDGIRPVLRRTALEFLIWGLRNMQPYKLTAVDTPIVVIQVGNVEIRTKTLKSLKKYPFYSQQLYYAISHMPVDELYFPPIVIRVKDNRKFGRRPVVGQHVISNVAKYRVNERVDSDSYLMESPDDGSLTDELHEPSIEVGEPAKKGKRARFLRKLKQVLKRKQSPRLSRQREDEFDWWSKYYASIGLPGSTEEDVTKDLSLIKIFNNELEKQEEFENFFDFVETFRLGRGKSDASEESEFAGEFKGSFKIYHVSTDPSAPLPERIFCKLPPADVIDVKVRVYVIRGFDLAPQDPNGLADPYLKLKFGKKRVDDRSHYIPNTLEPTFGKMFEVDVKIPMEKDLHVQVYDWDLIGTDDKIGETVIDLENRYLTKYQAWCGLPEAYYTSGPTPWRDQSTPKDMLYRKSRIQGLDAPVWNGNTCVRFNETTYNLSQFEDNKPQSKYLGEPEQRLSLHILRSFPFVPEHVETRPLYSRVHPGIEQGRLHMWVDMFPKDFGDPGPPFDISNRQPAKHFIRVIIWNCSDIPLVDTSFTGEKMTDIYFKGWITGLEDAQKKTDVNYRSMDGTGMFNWRFIFPMEYLPQERLHSVSRKLHLWSVDKTSAKFPPILNIQAWDNDLFLPNQYISEVSLALNKMPRCTKFKRSCDLSALPDLQGNCKNDIISMFEQRLLQGWWPLYKIVDGERKLAGKVEMTIEVVTEEEHEERPAGSGHDEPNLNPKLEKPIRPATSFAWFTSPLKSFRYIIWRKYRSFIVIALVVILLLIFLVLFVYAFPVAVTNRLIG